MTKHVDDNPDAIKAVAIKAILVSFEAAEESGLCGACVLEVMRHILNTREKIVTKSSSVMDDVKGHA